MVSRHEYLTYTVSLAENTDDEALYELQVTRDAKVDRVLEVMENDGWDLVNLGADGGRAVMTFRKAR